RERRLKALLPFVSKDLDLIGTEADAAQVAQRIGWHLTPSVVGGGPVQAILSSEPEGAGLAVDFLSQIKGVSYESIVENARVGSVRVAETSEIVAVRVLDPVLLLAGTRRRLFPDRLVRQCFRSRNSTRNKEESTRHIGRFCRISIRL